MKEQKYLSIKQYYLIKTVYVISIIICVIAFISLVMSSIGYIYGAASSQYSKLMPIIQIFLIIKLFSDACTVALMLIFAVNKSLNRSKRIKAAAVILIISSIPGYLLSGPSYTINLFDWITYIPCAFFISLLIVTISGFHQVNAFRKQTSDALFVILLCIAIGSLVYILVSTGSLIGLGYLFLAFILFMAYKDKGINKYFIEAHPKYLIKGRKYSY